MGQGEEDWEISGKLKLISFSKRESWGQEKKKKKSETIYRYDGSNFFLQI